MPRCKKCQRLDAEFYPSDRHRCKECRKALSKEQALRGYFRERSSKPKTCARCLLVLPSAEFIRHSNGRSRNCKNCIHAASAEMKSETKPKNLRKKGRVKLSPFQNVCYWLWTNSRRRAAIMNRSFELRREWVEDAVGDFCQRNHHSFEKRNPFLPSLDRIDNNMGYTSENVRVVWLIENLARNLFTEDQLIEFCKRKLGIL